MPRYDFRCPCGTQFEGLLASWAAPDPECPRCGQQTARLPSRISPIGNARPPMGDTRAPTSFEGTGNGNREYIAEWRRRLDTRRRFEEANPEHATKREAIAAHEGAFSTQPLTYRELAGRAASTGDATAAAAEASKARTAGARKGEDGESARA